MSKKIVVVYHSGYGHTKRMAQVVAESAGAALIAIDAEGNLPDGAWDQLAAADMIVFGSPTYMGMVSWQFKKFADASAKPWFGQAWRNKLAAGFTNSASLNGDKGETLHYMFTLAMQHGMLWAGMGMLPANHSGASRASINNLGSFAGAMASSPSDLPPDQMVEGDLATAREFGKRLIEAVGLVK